MGLDLFQRNPPCSEEKEPGSRGEEGEGLKKGGKEEVEETLGDGRKGERKNTG